MMSAITRRTALAMPLALGFFGAASTARAAVKPVRLGLLQPFSGVQSVYGRDTQPMVEMLAKEVNAAGGIKSLGGAMIEIVSADTGSASGQAQNEMRRLSTQENVDAVLGALLTNDFLAVAGAIDEYKMPTISMFGGQSRSKYAYSVGFAYDDGYAGSMVDLIAFLKNEAGFPIKRAATAYANYEAGQQINKFIRERLEKIGVEVVADIALDMKSTDYLPALMKIRSAKPDVVVGLQLHNHAVNLMQARYQLKYHDPLFISNLAYGDPRLRRDLGDAIATEVLPLKVMGMTYYSREAKLGTLSDLVKRIEVAHPKEPFNQLGVAAAQAFKVMVHALEMAGSTDKEKLAAAIGQVSLPAGHPDLYFPLANGLAFGDDRLIKNLRSLMIQWSPMPTVEPLVIYPKGYTGNKPLR